MKPKQGDGIIDHKMRPPRVRRYDREGDQWLTEDEYEYRMAKRAEREEIENAQFR